MIYEELLTYLLTLVPYWIGTSDGFLAKNDKKIFIFSQQMSHNSFRRHLLEKLDDRIFWRFFFSTVGGGILKNTIFLTKARKEWKKNPQFIHWNTPFAATNSLWELQYCATMLVSLLLWHCACTRHFKRLTVLWLVCAVDQKQGWLGGLE